MNKFIVSLLSIVVFCSLCEGAVVPDSSNLKVLTPSLAQRTTRKLRLDNQLEVLLVSDPETPYSAAALAVGSGSSQDPMERAGLAHYTEHMLFLGNAKYPEEEEFSHYLDSYGGRRNAFTMADRTVYMFSITNEGFEGALDRFAHFFISPNFTESGLQRECKAIHQEYCKNLPSDDWRMLYVKKELCNPKHSFHSFSMGNLETLHDVSHEEIKKWYQTNYSANLMRLCLYSNKSLDELEAAITPLFETIENQNIVRTAPEEMLFNPKQELKCCFVTPLQERCSLELSWELPRHFVTDRELHIDKLVSYILGHEGENSLLAKLKKEGLAHKLGCGRQKASTTEALFVLSMELTNKGAAQYERVLSHCFETIQALRKEGIERHIYDEVQKTEEINYCYQTRGDLFDYVMENATYMIDEPIETFPRKCIAPTTFDKEAFNELLATLIPTKAHYMLLAPPKLTGMWPDRKEQWMQVAYTERPIRKELIKQWEKEKTNHTSALPLPNPFIPTELKVSAAPFKKGAHFDVITKEKNEKGTLYIAQDHCFLTPETSWQVHYKTALVTQKQGKSAALMDLFALAFKEAVNETLYAAKLAQLHFSLSSKEDGFLLSVNGFEEKSPLLMEILCKKLSTLTLSKAEFITYKEMLLKNYSSYLLESPLKQANDIVSSIIHQDYQTIEQKADALSSLTLKEFNHFCTALFAKGYLEASCYSSQKSEGAKEIFDMMIEKLAFAPYPQEEQWKRKLARFATIGKPTYLENRFPMAAGGLMVALDFGDFSFDKRAVQEILSKALEEPFFSELRTKQQTAYVVANWSQEIERHLYNFFAIQSSSHDPRDLLARFELFLESFMLHLERNHLPEERFEMIKQSLVKQLTNPQCNFSMMGTLFHTLAFEYEGDFEWLQKRAEAVKALSYEGFLQSVRRAMSDKREERIAVLINGTFEEKAPFAYELSTSIKSIKERLIYK